MKVVYALLEKPTERGVHAKVEWLLVNRGVYKGAKVTLNNHSDSWKIVNLFDTKYLAEHDEDFSLVTSNG